MDMNTSESTEEFSVNDAMVGLIQEEVKPDARPVEDKAVEIIQAEQPETAAERMERIQIDGKEEEVPISKLIERYQKATAAEKRFEEAAAIEKSAKAVLAERENDRKQLEAATKYFQEQAQSLLPPKPNVDLLNTDPVEYLRQDRLYNERVNAIAQAQTAQAHLQQLRQQEQSAREAEELAKSRDFLLKEIPTWSDPAKASLEQKRIADHMRSLGNDDQRIQTIKSAADVIAYRESMLYRDLLAKAKETSKQLTKLPPKVERPGNGSKGNSDALQRFNKTGSFNDALEALNSGLLNSRS